jgi:hypothetical protein
VLWIPPTAQSSPGISSFYNDYEGPLFAEDNIQLGKANSSSANSFFMSLNGGSPSLPFVWGTRYSYQGTSFRTDYQWSAGFSITCQAPANSTIVSLVFGSYLYCLFGTGNNYSTTRRFGLVLQTASGNDCKAVSVQSETRYNECLEPNVLGGLFTWCRIEIPFPLSIQINGEGTALNGTLYPWDTPVLSSTPASVSFVVSKKDCCFQCDSGSTNVCCNPLP